MRAPVIHPPVTAMVQTVRNDTIAVTPAPIPGTGLVVGAKVMAREVVSVATVRATALRVRRAAPGERASAGTGGKVTMPAAAGAATVRAKVGRRARRAEIGVRRDMVGPAATGVRGMAVRASRAGRTRTVQVQTCLFALDMTTPRFPRTFCPLISIKRRASS